MAHLRLENVTAGRHAVGKPYITADDRPFSNGNAAQDRGPGIDYDVVFHDRMAGIAFDHSIFIFRKACSAEKEGHIISFVGRLLGRELFREDTCGSTQLGLACSKPVNSTAAVSHNTGFAVASAEQRPQAAAIVSRSLRRSAAKLPPECT